MDGDDDDRGLQVMITQRMRRALEDELGYTADEVDSMEPSIAAVVIERGLSRPSNGMPQSWQRPPSSRGGRRSGLLKRLSGIASKAAGIALLVLAAGAGYNLVTGSGKGLWAALDRLLALLRSNSNNLGRPPLTPTPQEKPTTPAKPIATSSAAPPKEQPSSRAAARPTKQKVVNLFPSPFKGRNASSSSSAAGKGKDKDRSKVSAWPSLSVPRLFGRKAQGTRPSKPTSSSQKSVSGSSSSSSGSSGSSGSGREHAERKEASRPIPRQSRPAAPLPTLAKASPSQPQPQPQPQAQSQPQSKGQGPGQGPGQGQGQRQGKAGAVDVSLMHSAQELSVVERAQLAWTQWRLR